jgi:hypothetical protein
MHREAAFSFVNGIRDQEVEFPLLMGEDRMEARG